MEHGSILFYRHNHFYLTLYKPQRLFIVSKRPYLMYTLHQGMAQKQGAEGWYNYEGIWAEIFLGTSMVMHTEL